MAVVNLSSIIDFETKKSFESYLIKGLYIFSLRDIFILFKLYYFFFTNSSHVGKII